MYDKSMRRSALMVAGALGLAGAFFAGVALAADPAFDAANDSITHAIAQLESIQAPAGDKAPFGGHRHRAIEALKHAQDEIAKAKAFQDNPPPAKPGKPKDKDKG